MADGINPWTAFWNQRESGDRATRMREAEAEQAAIDLAKANAPSKYSSSGFTTPSVGNLWNNVKQGALSYVPGTDENQQFTDSIQSLWGDMQREGTRSNLEAEIGGGARLAPGISEAGDFAPGEGMDFENDFTDEDIVDAVAPKAPGKKKMSKPQAKRRAAVQQAVKPNPIQASAKRFATVDPLNLFGNKNGVNPFSRGNSAPKGNRFSGGVAQESKRPAASASNLMDLF